MCDLANIAKLCYSKIITTKRNVKIFFIQRPLNSDDSFRNRFFLMFWYPKKKLALHNAANIFFLNIVRLELLLLLLETIVYRLNIVRNLYKYPLKFSRFKAVF